MEDIDVYDDNEESINDGPNDVSDGPDAPEYSNCEDIGPSGNPV